LAKHAKPKDRKTTHGAETHRKSEELATNGSILTEDGEGHDKPPEKLGRRVLMLRAAAGVGAAAASLAGSETAGAQGTGNGQAVELGEANTCNATALVTTNSGDGLYCISVGTSGQAARIRAGVIGDSNTNLGVVGVSSAADGVYGQSTSNGAAGVAGVNASSGGGSGIGGQSQQRCGAYSTSVASSGLSQAAGVVGDSNTCEGVTALLSANNGVSWYITGNGKNGVYGADNSDAGNGVYGYSSGGTGVYSSGRSN
jgi:hypothetical protein